MPDDLEDLVTNGNSKHNDNETPRAMKISQKSEECIYGNCLNDTGCPTYLWPTQDWVGFMKFC
jgi:hypothetical protein